MRTWSMFIGLSLFACLTGCAGGETGEPQASTPSATPSAQSSIPAGTASIEPGTYRIPASAWSVVDFTVTFPEDWTVQYGHIYATSEGDGTEVGFYAVVVDSIWAEACVGSGSGAAPGVGPSVDDLSAALLKQPGPMAKGPIETTLGRYPATRIDLTVPKRFDLSKCNAKDIGLQIWYSAPADKNFILLADGIASVYILDVGGQRQVFLTQRSLAAPKEDVRELQTILDSIQIEP